MAHMMSLLFTGACVVSAVASAFTRSGWLATTSIRCSQKLMSSSARSEFRALLDELTIGRDVRLPESQSRSTAHYVSLLSISASNRPGATVSRNLILSSGWAILFNRHS